MPGRDRDSAGGGGFAPHLPPADNLNVNLTIRLDPAVMAVLTKIADALAAPKSEITPEMIAAATKSAQETQDKLKAGLEKGAPPPT